MRIADTVAHVLFDRPWARNAMTWAMYDGLVAACAAINENSSVRVAVLRGAGGKAFVAGTDIAQFREFGSGDDGVTYEARLDGLAPRSILSGSKQRCSTFSRRIVTKSSFISCAEISR